MINPLMFQPFSIYGDHPKDLLLSARTFLG